MQKITPFLWFDHQAEQAMNLYTSVFKNGRVGQITRYGEAGPGPAGSVLTASFELDSLQITALNGGPHFNFTPAISFFVNCQTETELDRLWESLSASGSVLMPLEEYPFSKKFGWLADQYGVNWQLNLDGRAQMIIPFLMFVGEQHGKAEEAMDFYTSVFPDSRVENLVRYRPGQEEPAGSVMQGVFRLAGQEFMAIDSSLEHSFTFNEAVSFQVNCRSQEEVDFFWEKLGEGGDPDAQQCGWLKDRYGVSWQIVPYRHDSNPTRTRPARRAGSARRALLRHPDPARLENFDITGIPISHYPRFINSLAYIKKAAALANAELGLLEPHLAQAIARGLRPDHCRRYHNEFAVDVIQGGAGTSTNMNANEVIANLALEMTGL
jgi:predicted 3-demethylubiquinone-9 3-methyltransferase (glyoxalase superfamily)